MSEELLSYRDIMKVLEDSGHQAYVVGGAVRNAYLNLPIKDFDIVTSATPEEVIALFDGASIINAAFSVAVHVPSSETGGVVEVVTMRTESDKGYENGRPTEFSFTTDILEDLKRRDMRFNAIAMDRMGNITDPFDGRADLDEKVVRAIGDPEQRIKAHPIRMLRYARFATSLGEMFTIDPKLVDAIIKNRILIVRESWDAIGKEFMKGMASNLATKYLITLKHLGLLEIILPEVFAMIACGQNIHHNFTDVWTHTLRCILEADRLEYEPLHKLAVLLHDVGKPPVREYRSREYGATFYQHEVEGATIAEAITRRLRLPEDDRSLVILAVRNHMYDVTSEATARRFLKRLDSGGNSSVDIMKKRAALVFLVKLVDKMGRPNSDVPSQEPFRLVMAELEKRSPFKVTDLAINGNSVMNHLGIKPGVEVGRILNELLDLVIDGKVENEREVLLDEARRIHRKGAAAVAAAV